MTDFETHPVGTAARIAELESANGVHIFRALSKQEMVEVEKMAADGKFQEAAQKFGGQVTYHQDQRDLPPMTNAELALHLRGGLVPMSVAYRAASRIEQLVGTVELLAAALTRANAATAAAYEVAARLFDDGNSVTGAAIGRCIRALATPDQTAALDRLIAEAVEQYVDAMRYYETQFCEGFCEDMPDRSVTNEGMENDCSGCKARAILAASKKGGV